MNPSPVTITPINGGPTAVIVSPSGTMLKIDWKHVGITIAIFAISGMLTALLQAARLIPVDYVFNFSGVSVSLQTVVTVILGGLINFLRTWISINRYVIPNLPVSSGISNSSI